MQSDNDDVDLTVRLLSSMDLDDVTEIVAEIVNGIASPAASAVLMWDQDLEEFGERFVFGSKKKDLVKPCEKLCTDFELPDKKAFEVDSDDLGVSLHKDLSPLVCYKIERDGSICALIVAAGTEVEEDELQAALDKIPMGSALHNAWEFKEVQRENERLRSQYEEMEDKTSMLEEQTHKLIRDITSHNAIRTRQVERERLVYSISNVVRSSVHIQEVLDTTVREIGKTFQVSRCMLLRSADSVDHLAVYEYRQDTVLPGRDAFMTPLGLTFTKAALSRRNPHDLGEPGSDDQSGYDTSFLQGLWVRSGLIVPLVLRDSALGVLFLQDCVEPRYWSIDDVSLIGSLADNVSVAIENAELHQERERQAVTDGLTGVANRRSFNETFEREFERAKRYGEPLSLVIIDLDFLKKINDTFGHQAGDEAIKSIGHVLRQSSRQIDLPARYGGEEFCLLLPNTEIGMAEQLAERLRRLINEVSIEGPGSISASLGVASYPLHSDEMEDLFQKADEALYAAKQAGRNQVKIAQVAENSGQAVSKPHTDGVQNQMIT